MRKYSKQNRQGIENNNKPKSRIPNEALQIFCQFENPTLLADIEKFVSGIGTYYGCYDFSRGMSWSPSTPVQPLGYYLFFGESFSHELPMMATAGSSPFRNGELIRDLAILNKGYILIIDRNFIEPNTWDKYVSYCDKYGWSISWIIIDTLRELPIPKARSVYYCDPQNPASIETIKEIILKNYNEQLQLFNKEYGDAEIRKIEPS